MKSIFRLDCACVSRGLRTTTLGRTTNNPTNQPLSLSLSLSLCGTVRLVTALTRMLLAASKHADNTQNNTGKQASQRVETPRREKERGHRERERERERELFPVPSASHAVHSD